METIEERAAHYVSLHVCSNKQTYIDGATEQKAIDEESQTEEMRQLNEEWKENLRIQREMLIDKACAWLKKWTLTPRIFTPREAIEAFRKAMEEKT